VDISRVGDIPNSGDGPLKDILYIPFFWLIAEGSAENLGVHITLFIMSAAIVALTFKNGKNSGGANKY